MPYAYEDTRVNQPIRAKLGANSNPLADWQIGTLAHYPADFSAQKTTNTRQHHSETKIRSS